MVMRWEPQGRPPLAVEKRTSSAVPPSVAAPSVSSSTIALALLTVAAAVGAAIAYAHASRLGKEGAPPERYSGMFLSGADLYRREFIETALRKQLNERAYAATNVAIILTALTALFGIGFTFPPSWALPVSIGLSVIGLSIIGKVKCDLAKNLSRLRAESGYMVWLMDWSKEHAITPQQVVIEAFEKEHPDMARVLRFAGLAPYDIVAQTN
jgi:hypothetical protein